MRPSCATEMHHNGLRPGQQMEVMSIFTYLHEKDEGLIAETFMAC